MRSGENRIQNNISTLAVNYVICLVLGLFYTLSSGTQSIIVSGPEGHRTILMGLINGVFYVGSFILLQYNIKKNGVVLPSTFMKLGVLVPTMIAIVVFGERPGALQVAGLMIAIAAIVYMNMPGQRDMNTVTAPKALVLLLLVGGSGDAMSKIYKELGSADYNAQFLLYTFGMALVLCTLTAVLNGQRLTWRDLFFGCLIGIPNYYSARFLLMSLSYVPAVIAYPTYSTGTIALVCAAGVLIFHEKMTRREWTAIAMIIAALLLLNASQ